VPVTGLSFLAGGIAYRTCTIVNRLIARPKRNNTSKILTVEKSIGVEFFVANLRRIPSIVR